MSEHRLAKGEEFYVIVRLRNSRTGVHTRREGPYPFARAMGEARAYARLPYVENVWVNEGSPWFTDHNTVVRYTRGGSPVHVREGAQKKVV